MNRRIFAIGNNVKTKGWHQIRG